MIVRKFALQAARKLCDDANGYYALANVQVQGGPEGPRMIATDGKVCGVIEDPYAKPDEATGENLLVSVDLIDALGKVPKSPRRGTRGSWISVTMMSDREIRIADEVSEGELRALPKISVTGPASSGTFPEVESLWKKRDGYRHQLFNPRLLLRALEAFVLARDPYGDDKESCILSMGPTPDCPLMISSSAAFSLRVAIILMPCNPKERDAEGKPKEPQPWQPFLRPENEEKSTGEEASARGDEAS